MARALGLKSAGGNAFRKMISRQGIGSALPQELRDKIDNPIVFKAFGGDPGHGYEVTVLIEVCDAIIQAGHDRKRGDTEADREYARTLRKEMRERRAAK